MDIVKVGCIAYTVRATARGKRVHCELSSTSLTTKTEFLKDGMCKEESTEGQKGDLVHVAKPFEFVNWHLSKLSSALPQRLGGRVPIFEC